MMTALSLSDVSLVPQYSTLNSRSEVDLSMQFASRTWRLPIIGSPMDTVVDLGMASALITAGCCPVHHRYCSEETLHEAIRRNIPIAVSPSLGLKFLQSYPFSIDTPPIFVLDTAHGDTEQCLKYAESLLRHGIVISGNIVTMDAARRYLRIGVKYLRVGIGGGAACSTRVVAGVGIPSYTAIKDIHEDSPEAFLIADGGMRSSGDIVKALAAGASAVMLGRMLAGAKEAPGKRRLVFPNGDILPGLNWEESWKKNAIVQKEFRGMASEAALDDAGKERNVEGVSGWIPEEGSVKEIVDKIERGLRAGFAYVGARNITELHQKAEFVQVTENGYLEGLPKL